MRRLAFFALASLAALLAQQQPNKPRPANPAYAPPVTPAPPAAARPAWRFDAADYGYPGAAGADPAVPVQRAFDAAAAYVAGYRKAHPGFPPRAVVHVPADAPRYTRSPVYCDSSYVEFWGDGRGSRLMASPTFGHPVFVVGIPRVSADGFTPGPAVRPDLFGLLDATAAPSAGKLWGLAIGPTFLWQHGGALDRGGPSPTRPPPTCDGFSETSQLTVEWAIGPAPGATAVPAGTWAGVQGCYAVNGMDAKGGYAFVFTSVGPDGGPAQALARFAAPNPAGLKRITVQADLTPASGPVVAAWVDGVQVAVTPTGLAGPRTFARNEFAAFTAGCAISGPTAQPPFGVATVAPHNLYGFCLSRSLRYAVGAAGSAQARADGQPITDAYRYFPTRNVAMNRPAITDPQFLAFLALTENPALARRHMQVAGGSDYGSVAFVGDRGMFPGGSGLPTQLGNAFRDLSVVGDRYGQGIEVSGGVLGLTMEGVDAEGGAYGVGT
ncbi:MAG TPA: hypothetical protein VH092_13945, partial [Urbifossiella sp.]|nr:hypothetical protein [Urbifossiella sp.]